MKLTAGRIVEYCLESGPNAGSYRPALVVRALDDQTAQLSVFVDDTDGPDMPVIFRSSVKWEEVGPGTWRWPLRE
jgi:hypothetical protein